jgi:putative ABC transport system permease protein
LQAGHRGAVLRKVLVVTQFLVSIVLLAATAVVFQQLRYMQHKHLGFDREQVVNIQVRDAHLLERMELLQHELVQLPGVVNATVSSSGVGDFMRSTIMGPSTPEDTPNRMMTGFIFADPEYLPTLGMELVAGRNFSRELAPVAGTDVILNETAARRYGWANPEAAIGERLTENGWFEGGTVVGVVRDFNIRSLRSGIPPALIAWARLDDDAVVSVRIRPGNVAETLAVMEDRWDALVPDWPFEYAFLDAELDRLHRQDRQTGKLFGIFATLAVFIACLGLFGLAAFAAEQRTKEVGVRKVMGATEAQVVLLLSKEFTVLVLVAFALAVPLIYYFMNQWLNEFAFHTDLSWPVFAFAGATALLVAFLTVSYQAVKAARTNPVQALRYE